MPGSRSSSAGPTAPDQAIRFMPRRITLVAAHEGRGTKADHWRAFVLRPWTFVLLRVRRVPVVEQALHLGLRLLERLLGGERIGGAGGGSQPPCAGRILWPA